MQCNEFGSVEDGRLVLFKHRSDCVSGESTVDQNGRRINSTVDHSEEGSFGGG